MFPVEPDAPLWMSVAAQLLLVVHVSGGVVGLVTGAGALLTRKGGRLHRGMGAAFVISMLAMAGLGAGVALYTGDRINALAGFMALYFVASGWVTARQRANGAVDLAVLLWAIAIVGAAPVLASTAARAPDGGWTPFYVFTGVVALAALCDLKVLLRRGIAGAQRVARHVWRMCFALFVATLSFFLGQAEIFPAPLRESILLLVVLALSPLGFLIFWMLRVRLSRKWRGMPEPARALTPIEQDA